MEICHYHHIQNNSMEICTYDLKDEAGIYDQELVMEWKRRAAKRKLFCADCGSPVYLAAGLKREPYFAHYDMVSCAYGKRMESQELMRGKRLLYHMLKRSFPAKEVKVRYRLFNGLYAACYVKNEEGYDLAIDYRLHTLPIKEGIRKDILLNCIELIQNGKEEMVSKKYLDYMDTLLEE